MQWSSDISTWFHTYSPSGWSVSSQNARDGNGTLAGWFLPSGPGRNPRLVFTVSPRGISGWHFFWKEFWKREYQELYRSNSKSRWSKLTFVQIVYVIRSIHDSSKELKQSMDIERCIRTPSICTHLLEPLGAWMRHRMRYLALPLRAFCFLLGLCTFTCCYLDLPA